jgi:hypothetical protein
MKDLPHHIQKLNRRIIRDAHRDEIEEVTFESALDLHRSRPKEQMRKQEKTRLSKARHEHVPMPKTPDIQNKLEAKRTPVFFSKNHQKPKTTRPTRKRTPRLSRR